MQHEPVDWDYVIVGSGAGGGTLAARLAERGMRVCVLEAGVDPRRTAAERLPDDYNVPGFHPFACENPAMSWDFFVRHYTDESRQARDPKYDAARGGVLYPRAAALGGCTAHNAMIFALPHESDWDGIAAIAGDASWSGRRMRRYAKRLEACYHRPVWRFLRRFGIDPTGHGWNGWLDTEKPAVLQALADPAMVAFVAQSALAFFKASKRRLARLRHALFRAGDPNARSWGGGSFEGLCYTPLSTAGHRRTGARDRLRRAQAANPDRLHIELDALAVKVLFDDTGAATGVEYLKGAGLYGASAATPAAATRGAPAGELQRVHARHEVILAGGAFNTPQLLMLSGIGPAQQLRKFGISVRVDLPGVGCNLQDRYEVALTHRMVRRWQLLEGAEFARGDPQWNEWVDSEAGLYASNGAALAFVRRSASTQPEPDIFCMALPVKFQGYFRGFSAQIREHHDYLSWVVLKAYARNRAGTVELQSADPRVPPLINFRYFADSTTDLEAVVGAIEFVRKLTAPLMASGVIAEEVSPGPGVASTAELSEYVRNTAWGHHASCTCPIGAVADGGVVDGNFAVHGTSRLRVVDASIFPRIPGFFLVSAVYMIAEKAADALCEAAQRRPAPPRAHAHTRADIHTGMQAPQPVV